MALDPNINTREFLKFKLTPNGGKHAVRICADGTDPIPVTFDTTSDLISAVSTFGTASSVASSATAVVATYTVPVGKTFFLQRVEASGNNIATYSVEAAATEIAKKRTWFGGNISPDDFVFAGPSVKGVEYAAGTTIELKVTNFRPSVGDFEGRILGVEVG